MINCYKGLFYCLLGYFRITPSLSVTYIGDIFQPSFNMPSFRHAMQVAERPFNCETGNFLVISGTNDKYIYLFILFITIYGIQKQKPKDEMQKSRRPHIKADHQWY